MYWYNLYLYIQFMLKPSKTLLCSIFAWFLILNHSPYINAEETTTFSEFPDSYTLFNDRLLSLTKDIDNCKNTRNCEYLSDYTRVLKSDINTLLYWTKEYYYIRYYYGKKAYQFIRDNSSLLDLHFDIYLTKELMNYNQGLIVSVNNWYTKDQVSLLYSEYIKTIWYEKLNNLRNKSKTLKQKAIYEYFIYSIFTDTRLYK